MICDARDNSVARSSAGAERRRAASVAASALLRVAACSSLVRCSWLAPTDAMMTAAALLDQKKDPSDADIDEAFAGLKCRCGTHMGIKRAVKRAAKIKA